MKKLFILLLLLIFFIPVYSQWSPTGGPNAQAIYSLLIKDNHYIAGTYNGVFVSTNSGETWEQKNNGFSSSPRKVYALTESGNKILAGSDSGIYVTTNYGNLWTAKSSGIPAGNSMHITALIKYGANNIFAGSWGGVYLTVNEGESWLQKNSGLTILNIYSFVIKQNKLFAGTDRTVFVSTDLGNNWNMLYTGIPNGFSVDALGTNGTNLVLGLCCSGGVYLSTNDGANWSSVLTDLSAATFTYANNKLVLGSTNGILISDNGSAWTYFNQGLQYLSTTALAFDQTTLLAGVENNVWRRPLNQVIGISNSNQEIPKQFILFQNYPNPFNPKTVISYELRVSSYVKLSVYNAEGQHISDMINNKQSEGTYKIEWNAENQPSGVYFYQLTISNNQSAIDYTETKKMVLLK